jgi:hypothetical protein
VCLPILRSLPDWFGIEEALVHYSAEIDQHQAAAMKNQLSKLLTYA